MPTTIGQRILGRYRNWFWILAAVVTALDQLTKHVFAPVGGMPYKTVLVPGFLDLIGRPLNPQGAFSLGPSTSLFYIVLTTAGLALVLWFFVTSPADRLLPHFALGCVAGGALGNLIDRLILKGVRDFIDLHWMDRAHWPTFNIADTAICVGVALLIWDALRSPPAKQPAEAKDAGGKSRTGPQDR